jgi:hypothetical protein
MRSYTNNRSSNGTESYDVDNCHKKNRKSNSNGNGSKSNKGNKTLYWILIGICIMLLIGLIFGIVHYFQTKEKTPSYIEITQYNNEHNTQITTNDTWQIEEVKEWVNINDLKSIGIKFSLLALVVGIVFLLPRLAKFEINNNINISNSLTFISKIERFSYISMILGVIMACRYIGVVSLFSSNTEVNVFVTVIQSTFIQISFGIMCIILLIELLIKTKCNILITIICFISYLVIGIVCIFVGFIIGRILLCILAIMLVILFIRVRMQSEADDADQKRRGRLFAEGFKEEMNRD